VTSVSDSGSSFILVLPGLGQIGDDSVGAVLERALADEEVLLEEAAVLRAIRSAGRPVAMSTPPRDPGKPRLSPEPGTVPVRLRSIEGSLSRTDPPGPA
jgi:hypothetical protein